MINRLSCDQLDHWLALTVVTESCSNMVVTCDIPSTFLQAKSMRKSVANIASSLGMHSYLSAPSPSPSAVMSSWSFMHPHCHPPLPSHICAVHPPLFAPLVCLSHLTTIYPKSSCFSTTLTSTHGFPCLPGHSHTLSATHSFSYAHLHIAQPFQLSPHLYHKSPATCTPLVVSFTQKQPLTCMLPGTYNFLLASLLTWIIGC